MLTTIAALTMTVLVTRSSEMKRCPVTLRKLRNANGDAIRNVSSGLEALGKYGFTHHAKPRPTPCCPPLAPLSAAVLSAFTIASDAVSILIFEFLEHFMAQNATIYKVELSVSDMDRHYYETHKLTVARHPSETDERLMVRILAFALNAHEHLEMTKGLSTDDEPDIWQKSLTGELDVWVALGLPSEKVLRQSCGKAKKVVVYPYGGRTAEMWWDKMKSSATRFDNLQVTSFSEKDTGEMAKLASRVMKLQVNIQDGEVMVSVGDSIVYVTPLKWKSAA